MESPRSSEHGVVPTDAAKSKTGARRLPSMASIVLAAMCVVILRLTVASDSIKSTALSQNIADRIRGHNHTHVPAGRPRRPESIHRDRPSSRQPRPRQAPVKLKNVRQVVIATPRVRLIPMRKRLEVAGKQLRRREVWDRHLCSGAEKPYNASAAPITFVLIVGRSQEHVR